MTDRSAGNSWTGTSQGHVCNCIGCCTKCGQCRTAPWHPATCGSIAALNKAKSFIIDQAMKPKEVKDASAPCGCDSCSCPNGSS